MFDICIVASPGETWETQWSYLLSHFKPRTLYVIGEIDPRVRPFVGYKSVTTAEEVPGKLVVASPASSRYIPGNQSLLTYKHPEDCCYMFGADNAHLSTDHLGERVPLDTIFIPTDTADTMYSFMAGALVLYDRKMKNG